MSLVDIVTLDDTWSDIHTTPAVLNPLVGRRHPGDAMAIIIRLYEGASFSPDRLHNRPEVARYLLTLVTACSDRDTHTLSKFS
jgi:hypothetical protein